jgi:CHRD domain
MHYKLLTRTLFLVPFLLFQAVSAHAATVTFNASLLTSNQVPPISTSGSGTGTFTFDTVAQNIAFNIGYSGLSSNAQMAHIHFAPVGVNGPIILPFSPNPTGTSGTLTGILTTADLINQASTGIVTFTDVYNAALAGNLYANLHTVNFPAGEIRGQLAQQASAVPEPMTGLLFASGLLAIPLALRWRNKAQSPRN